MKTKSTNTKNKVTFQSETSNNRRLTRVFESKLFPHFTLFSSEVNSEPVVSSFLTAYRGQILKITDMIENNFLNYLFVEIMKTYPDKYLISSIKLGNVLVITASGNNNSFKYEYSLLNVTSIKL